jgi:hypothetical protein
MSKLRETIDRLVSTLAADVIAALREVPLEELTALAGKRRHQGRSDSRTDGAPKSVRSKRPPQKRAPRSSSKSVPTAPDATVVDAAQRFFAERGRRGATEPQVYEALKAQGIMLGDDAAGLVRVLLEKNAIHDAGFRRTTGTGTAPVYVLTSK